jgi:hypothetical protein
VSSAAGPRFDDSLASAGRNLHISAVIAAALVCACVLFVWLERRGRARWATVPVAAGTIALGPYRTSGFVAGYAPRAPWLVRSAAFGSLAFVLVFAPLVVLALVRYPFDVIAIPLLPGVALGLVNAWCAWLLLARSAHAGQAGRSGAVGSLITNVGLLAIAAFHFAAVELQRREGIEHACSSSVTFLTIVFAVSSVGQGLLTLTALRLHAPMLAWGWTPDPRSPRGTPG